MATTRAQQIGIWIIAVALTVGTIGSFVIIILANDNQKADQARLTQLISEYQQEMNDYQTKVDAQAAKLSKKYFATFNAYAKRPAPFDASAVTELTVRDLKAGSGAVLAADSSFTAYYLGWNPQGTVFDGSIDGKKLKAPISVTAGGVIAGWSEGIDGMKIGGIREVTIPAEKAYGESGNGDNIPPNTPLKFVIFVIPAPETIPEPQPSDELIKAYNQ